jgi:hypothetical protein
MSRKQPSLTVGEVSEGERRGQHLRVPTDDQFALWDWWSDCSDKLRGGRPGDLTVDQCDSLAALVDKMPLATPGRPRATEQHREQVRALDAEVRAFALPAVAELKRQGMAAADAWEQIARAVKGRWPDQYGHRSPKTIRDRLRRRI